MLQFAKWAWQGIKYLNLYARVRECETDRERLRKEVLVRDEKIARMEARLDLLESLSEIGTIEVDRQGRLCNSNDIFSEMSGYTHDELNDLPLYELLPFVLRRRHNLMFAKVVTAGAKLPALIQGELRRKDGSPLPVLVTTCEILSGSGVHFRADLRRR